MIQNWVKTLSIIEQSALYSALRGCDLEEPELKIVTRQIRFNIVNSTKDSTKYCDSRVQRIKETARIIINIGYPMSEHWYQHITHAISVISNRHPNPYVRQYWNAVHDIIKQFKAKK